MHGDWSGKGGVGAGRGYRREERKEVAAYSAPAVVALSSLRRRWRCLRLATASRTSLLWEFSSEFGVSGERRVACFICCCPAPATSTASLWSSMAFREDVMPGEAGGGGSKNERRKHERR